ncbi:eCIS core domain-containing protein [Scytonema sp. PRP1]|uniref:eCIS core domain-containing protein n=1 Tax=Scytonema sp. PRP1 TaxID=3120513 RepID=UPI00300D2E4C
MSTRAPTQTQTTPKPSFTPVKTGLLQRKCACGNSAGLTGKCTECENKRLTLQRRSSDQAEASEVPPIVHEVLQSPDPSPVSSRFARQEIPLSIPINALEGRLTPELQHIVYSLGEGQPLSPSVKSSLQPQSEISLDEVKVHENQESYITANAFNSEAFTVGNHIVMGDPANSTASGDWLLAHEVAHTIQQHPQNHKPTTQHAESEADQFADRVLAPGHQTLLPSLGSTPVGLARRVIWRHTQDLPGNLLLVVDVDDGDFVGGCVKAIVPHVGVKLIKKGVPKGARNQIFNIHIGYLNNARGESCIFFYESVSGLCEMKCFASKEELEEAWEEIKEWLRDLVEKVLKTLMIAVVVVAIVVLAYLIVQAILAALAVLALA